ncbi:unknown similar to AMEV241 [Choristoneura rosaceana entomopoxvirus 'L']|uniref:Uncharacterized protein n=2 Tax=Betaentomopoxvirus TaxID=10286 RepID=A0A916P709_CBEPV|nr:unknown similar to AMEV241 [Choristoneura biennis entomopoxvirus]YP_008004648.1 unknown similar to AMEV241 [Choristoneura rosaceana entomopoxvirus 'L']CCU55845.1 unknown similar to AMEV241 [Choristoneura biennis entomopoxvirus]CCU56146.1 unknown similar to AMEV241 [Choristoneura rosaceana entomopoxvirus 'L']
MEKELIDNIYTIIKYLPDESYDKLTIKSIIDLLYKYIKIINQTILKLLAEKNDINPLVCKDFDSQLDLLLNT